MAEQNPQPIQPKIDPETEGGVFSTGLLIMNSKYEFMMDFINAFVAPPKIVQRVITTPYHLKLFANAVVENLKKYQDSFGKINLPEQQKQSHVKTEQKDIYSKLNVSDDVLQGVYSNAMALRHSRDIFIIDFITTFPPNSKVTARIIISPTQMLIVADALKNSLARYESRFGIIDITATPDQTKMGFSLN